MAPAVAISPVSPCDPRDHGTTAGDFVPREHIFFQAPVDPRYPTNVAGKFVASQENKYFFSMIALIPWPV